MNKTFRSCLLTLFILFLLVHYLILNISKEQFPLFAYLYPFTAKIWFEFARLLLAFNIQIDFTSLFTFLKYFILLSLLLAILAYKNKNCYKLTIWNGLFIFAFYLYAIISLGLLVLYPLYCLAILGVFILFSMSIINKKNN